jgi:two-component system, sporulation sensor kinase D
LDIYTQKKRSKIILFILALIIIVSSIFYTNRLVNQFASQERKNVQLWAAAVHRKARLVEYTEFFFKQLQEEERKRVELLAEVYKHLLTDEEGSDLTFFLEIISNNNTIPVIYTNDTGKIISTKNLDYPNDSVTVLRGNLLEEFSKYTPIEVPISPFKKNFLYYQDSRFFMELKEVLNDYITSFMSEVALNSSSVPVIITDSTRKNVIQFGNLNDIRMTDPLYVSQKLEEMESENLPIEVTFGEKGTSYIFYQDSELLTIMRFFPLAQILIIAVFLAIAYLLFSYARNAEQNRVWAGMAKETAHQIGTPLSSIMAWMELLKMGEGSTNQAADEIEKDIGRLEVITERFSKIGSSPTLEQNDVVKIIYESIEYLKPRSPKKIKYNIELDPKEEIMIPLNKALFSWVIENLCKNAIDAMNGEGTITVMVKNESKNLTIDISDTGKGISRSEQKAIFNPGYTSKKRGWGLGLSLSKRIIRDYHKGKIFVKNSAMGKGSTFRIILKKLKK